MIIGVGIDIVDVDDFRKKLNDELIDEVFLPGEVEYAVTQARPWENYAVRFAAKEATFKALGAGISQGLRWKDVEVLRNMESGSVALVLRGRALEQAESRGMMSAFLSVSHSRTSAIAVVILEGETV